MRSILLATALLTTALLAPPQAVAAAPSHGASIAQFEGGTIDLRNGWGEATACASDGVNTECFRTEDELDQFLTAGQTALPLGPLVDLGIQSACATVLKLFSSPSFGGSVLALSTRSARGKTMRSSLSKCFREAITAASTIPRACLSCFAFCASFKFPSISSCS